MVDVTRVREIVDRNGRKKEHVIAMLQECQDEFYYLPREVLEALSKEVELPLTSILAIATFYKSFSLKPVGRFQIHVCMGTACNIQGAPLLVEAFQRELKIKKGETTDDQLFSLETVNCVGCCGLAPVATIGQDVHGKLKISSIPKLVKQYRSKEAKNAATVH
jgi:NADH:ubiquinone oxidoreductase subunit E